MIGYWDRTLLAQVLEHLAPADDLEPGGATLLPELDRAAGDSAPAWERIGALLDRLSAAGFGAASAAERDTLLHREQQAGAAAVAELLRLVAEARLAPRDAPAWAALGYDPAPKRPPAGDPAPPPLPAGAFADLAPGYDVVVVGSGAGGGVAARVLAQQGARVLLLERGQALTYADVGREHLRNHRYAAYGHNTGPEPAGNPRVYDHQGRDLVVESPWQPAWFNNAMTVGGGTRVYQGMAWRFLPDDFRMASKYGVPDGSSLADWPLSYDDLEPWYTRAESELGVCGDGNAHRVQGPRSAPYPMPPFPDDPEAVRLRAGAAALGISTGPVPLLINSVPRDGRGQCVRCGECVGFACPSEAKNGSHNTTIPLALGTGRCTLLTGARADRVLVDARGRATGVEVVDVATGARISVRAGAVVLSAGAIETARLLLASATSEHPTGLGNRTDQVGRHLQGHLYVSAFGLFDDVVEDGQGPGVTLGTCDWNHGNPGVIGGGALHNEVVKLPVLWHAWARDPDAPQWGAAALAYDRHAYRRTGHVNGPVHEIPVPWARVTLSTVADRHGSRVVRLSGRLHTETMRTAEHQRDRAREWLQASGARHTWVAPLRNTLTCGQHQAGTARMGADPATSVCDPYGRVHGHEGLWVLDASLHVTNGGFNPVLTILALAYRGAHALAGLSPRLPACT